MNQRFDIPPRIMRLAEVVKTEGGRLLLVGGCVRDFLMRREPKDFDAEVFGIEQTRLRDLLRRFGRVSTVGESFTVYKLDEDLDVSIPRRERKQGRGHRGFVVEGDHTMSVAEAARRRDFTINAISYDALTHEILDSFDGRKDLQNKLLRAVSHETFAEDSLRVLRAAQFAARFDFTIERTTVELCRTIDLSDLPSERIWGEMEKLLLQARAPSIGLRWLENLNATAQLFPELAALKDEAHTFAVVDRARAEIDDLPYAKRVAVMLAALCHAFEDEAKIVALLGRLKIFTLENYDVRKQTLALVREQSKPFEFYERRATDGEFRRLAAQCELNLLWRIARARDVNDKACAWFIERTRELEIEHRPPAPILRGRDLQEMGLPPSPAFGRILSAVYEMQLDGNVCNHDEARAAAQDMIETNS